ncbi:MAG: CDGSH iron-sulfur domain-containing protein [candidate division Zixibacteria bacterium]|nr:CDGSH iron-sulfur domain-containing protein [candidate division Zixibacteria bacterium]
MDKPIIAEKTPLALDLNPGTYYWCHCGKSANQPFCDGSHQGTAFQPLVFTVVEHRIRHYCRCKQTGTAPFCDGTHKSL